MFSHDASHIPRYANVRGFFKAITGYYLMHATVTLIRMQCGVGSGSTHSNIMFKKRNKTSSLTKRLSCHSG